MSEEKWRAELKRNEKFAAETMKKAGGVANMFIIYPRNAGPIPFLTGWSSAEERELSMRMVNLACMAHDAIALGHVSEAWVRMVDRRGKETEAEWQARVNAVRPSQAEDRIEALICTIVWFDGAERQSLMTTQRIVRDEQDKFLSLADREESRNNTGAITEVLPTQSLTPAARKEAKDILDMVAAKRSAPRRH
jgi:hypothetical protein